MKRFAVLLDKRMLENFNWPLLFTVLGLMACGLINLYSISSNMNSSGLPLYLKQLMFSLFGFGTLILVLLVDYQYLKKIAFPLYIGSLVLLLAVLFFGVEKNGAQRWLNLGFINVQPSELGKVVLVLTLASYFSTREYVRGLGYKELLVPGLLLLGPFILVLKQPDLGTALHMVLTCVPMFCFWRLKLELIITGFILVLAGIFVYLTDGWQILLEKEIIKPYQLKRIETFLNPEKDKTGDGWNIIQAKNAVGSGQVFGRGFMEGTQQKNGFLPVPESDFAFAAFAEEWGFVGCLIVLILFVLLIKFSLNVAARSKDKFGVFLSFGLTSFIFWQVIINMGMVVGLLPVVGIPLPFISYGGTSLVVSILAIGLILNVGMRRYLFHEETPVKENPSAWKRLVKARKNDNIVGPIPVRRLTKADSENPELFPKHRLPHSKPWLKHFKK